MKILNLIIALLVATNFSLGQSSKKIRTEFDNLLGEFSEDQPGGTVLVSQKGNILYHKAYGKANIELDVTMQKDNVISIGSVTKPFTAVAILKLIEEGKLSLKDEITDYIENFPTSGHKITIEHLLTHTSGIYNYNDDMLAYGKIENDTYEPKDFIDLFKDKPLDFEPGTKYKYCNSGYYLLGYIIEQVSNKNYEDYLKDLFFEPLDMKNTHYTSSKDIITNKASSYELSENGLLNARQSNKTTHYSAGGLQSTVADLHLWYKALANYEIIEEHTFKKAIKPYVLKNGNTIGNGYSWFLGNMLGSSFIAHDGLVWGSSSSMIYFPKEDVFAVTLSNCSCYNQNFYSLPHKLSSFVLDKKYYGDNELSDNKLNLYVGVYKSSKNEERKIISKNGHLFLSQPNGRNSKLYYYEKNNFYIENSYETIGFKSIESGKAKILISNMEKSSTFNRVNN